MPSYAMAEVLTLNPTVPVGSAAGVHQLRSGEREHVRGRRAGARVTVLACVMRKSWSCDGCRRQVRKGEAALVRIEVGVPLNRVYHAHCAPAS